MANEDKVGCHELCWNPGWIRCMIVVSKEWFPIQVLEHLKILLEVSKEFCRYAVCCGDSGKGYSYRPPSGSIHYSENV